MMFACHVMDVYGVCGMLLLNTWIHGCLRDVAIFAPVPVNTWCILQPLLHQRPEPHVINLQYYHPLCSHSGLNCPHRLLN